MNPPRQFHAVLLAVAWGLGAHADELESTQNVAGPDLAGICCVAISSDGRFAYTTAGGARALAIFMRDADTGKLTLARAVKGPQIDGPIRVRISRDDKFLVLADSHTNVATVFQRDPESGDLSKVADASWGENGALPPTGMTDASLSSDDRFLYTASSAGLGVYKFSENKLSFVQLEKGGDSLKGLRPFVISPDGHWLYAVADGSGALNVFSRDETTGKLDLVQTLSNGRDGISSLRGAFHVAETDDGKNVYVSSGRNHGDKAVSAFLVQSDGHLKFLQKFVNGAADFSQFEGGNELKVSPDGKWVCAVASTSDRLFRFGRDPETGKLTFLNSQQAGALHPEGAAGVCFSPDSKFVYVADKSENVVEVFKLP